MPSAKEDSPTGQSMSVELLMRLCQVTGRRFDLERIRLLLETMRGAVNDDPLAHLATAAKDLGLRLSPARMPLSEAVWHAHLDTPVILWCKPEGRYLIVSHARTFQVKLALYDDAAITSETISRGKLAARMGLPDVHESVEAGIILPLSPEEAASVFADHHAAELATRYGALSHRQSRPGLPEAGHQHSMPPFRRFLKILRPERRDILALLVFAMFSGVLYLALPLAVDTVVTNLAFGAQAQPYAQALLAIAQILTLCLFLQAFIIGFQHYVAELIQRRIFVRIAGDLAYRLPRVKVSALDGIHGPELVNRFLDVVTVQKNTAFFLLEGINTITASVIGMVLLSLYHPLLMAFVATLMGLILLVTLISGRKAVRTAIEESRSKYDLVGWFEEIATFPFMFKGPGGYELAYQRTNLLATQFVHARTRHFGVVFRQVSGLLLLSIIASVALLLLGTWLVLSQQITLGQLVASELIMSGIAVSLIKLGKKLESWYETLAATDKLGHLFDLETEPETGETLPHPHQGAATGMRVEARDISFNYEGGPTLFENRSFTLNASDRIALYGTQGSGVSSFLDLLFILRQPTSGHLSFDGVDSRNCNPENLREAVQILRRDEFIDGTIIENLRLGRAGITMEEIRNSLEEVGLLDTCLRHPDGLNQRLLVGGSPLSTSQRISLLIARALVQRPRLLLIDELFDGLDDITFTRLTRLVLNPEKPWTVVIATRMREVITICDRTVELSPTSSPSPEISPSPIL